MYTYGRFLGRARKGGPCTLAGVPFRPAGAEEARATRALQWEFEQTIGRVMLQAAIVSAKNTATWKHTSIWVL